MVEDSAAPLLLPPPLLPLLVDLPPLAMVRVVWNVDASSASIMAAASTNSMDWSLSGGAWMAHHPTDWAMLKIALIVRWADNFTTVVKDAAEMSRATT